MFLHSCQNLGKEDSKQCKCEKFQNWVDTHITNVDIYSKLEKKNMS